MQLFAYNQIGKPDELLIWVGVLGIATPLAVWFGLDGQAEKLGKPLVSFEPLGDEVCDDLGVPLNHRAIYALEWPTTKERFQIIVRSGNRVVTLTSKRPPVLLPSKNNQSFNLLLSSCYYQPNDKPQALSHLMKAIKPIPDFTLLAGDQVYLDLPSQQNLPTEKKYLAQSLGKKYQTNWFSGWSNETGLADVLSHGPVICIPDDHEFWNNFPLIQMQLNNTYRQRDRELWKDLATRFYERYQMSPAQGAGFFRQDIDPLSMLFLDGRTHRDNNQNHIFNAAALAAITTWKDDLLARKRAGKATIALLSSGQVLLIEKPGVWDRQVGDMEMENYKDFTFLTNSLSELFAADIPVLYITGDVHWGRIVEGRNQRGNPLFYEVIASPSRLIDSFGSDQINTLNNKFRNFISEPKPFPKHPEAPKNVHNIKLANLNLEIKHRQMGDHVALLRFHAISGGIEFNVDYICTDPDEKKRRQYSYTCGPYKMKSL